MHPQRLEAACRMLIDSGDMTPMAARILQKINAEELQSAAEGGDE